MSERSFNVVTRDGRHKIIKSFESLTEAVESAKLLLKRSHDAGEPIEALFVREQIVSVVATVKPVVQEISFDVEYDATDEDVAKSKKKAAPKKAADPKPEPAPTPPEETTSLSVVDGGAPTDTKPESGPPSSLTAPAESTPAKPSGGAESPGVVGLLTEENLEFWWSQYDDQITRRIPRIAVKCPRCGADHQSGRVPYLRVDPLIRICPNDGCCPTLREYAAIHGAEDDHELKDQMYAWLLPKLQATLPTTRSPQAADDELLANAVEKLKGSPELEDVPDENEATATEEVLGVLIELPPREWHNLPITKSGGESDGGQCKALNTALSEAGWGNKNRHPAVRAILNDPFINSLDELKKADADICLQWVTKATPSAWAMLAGRVAEMQSEATAPERKISEDVEL